MAQVNVPITKESEQWSEYELADGTVLRIRPVIVAALRSDDQFTADGDPVYNFKSQMIVDARVPPNLKKKVS